jgi:TorA maturation chaperone TorD
MEDAERKAEILTARSTIYCFISSLFLKEPSPEAIKKIREKEVLAIFKDFGIDFGVELGDKGEEELAEELAVEYTRLFIGPKDQIPPYESAHVNEGGTLWGDSTVKVSEFYRRYGYALAPEQNIPDHIGIELELMQHLVEMEGKSLHEGDSELASKYAVLQKEFLENHLLTWVPGFCKKIEKAAEHPFYRGLARLTREYLTAEYEGME